MKKILITGGNGFIGQALVNYCLSQNKKFVCAVRKSDRHEVSNCAQIEMGEIHPDTNWRTTLAGIDVIVHLAARAHNLNDKGSGLLEKYRKANTYSTLNLAKQAIECGVKRFVFMSSIGVNGNQNNRPFKESDAENPSDPYALSKYEAELGLRRLSKEFGLEVVILRPPLVYGPNAPGNFRRLLRIINIGLPLPFGNVKNSRSLISVNNLADLVLTCVEHPDAANQTFLAGEGENVSTTELLRYLSKALSKNVWLVPIPASVLMRAATLIGRRGDAARLLGSLQIDISKVKNVIGWVPPYTMEEEFSKIAKWYLLNPDRK